MTKDQNKPQSPKNQKSAPPDSPADNKTASQDKKDEPAAAPPVEPDQQPATAEETSDESSAPPDSTKETPLADLHCQPHPPQKKVLIIKSNQDKMSEEIAQILTRYHIPFLDRFDKENEPKTLDEILVSHPGINFAVVTLSGQEFVYPKSATPAEAKLRAPQPCVFALGFLIKHLGRQHVFVLYREQKSFLFPTPLHHVIYTMHDPHRHWQKELIDRLKQAGYLHDVRL